MSKMNIKDKDTKTLEKLKQFFRSSKGNYKGNEDHILTYDIEREISSQSPVHHRTRAIKDLCEDVKHNNWEDKAAEKFWNLVQDLLSRDTPKEHRNPVFKFLCCLIEGQYSRLSSLIRVKFFMVVKNHEIPEDISLRLELLQRLTTNGKDIRDLEEPMGQFLLEWMPTVTGGDGKRGADFLSLLINVIKYNSAYIDEEIVFGLVQTICHLCCFSNSADVVSGCLTTLETIVSYHKLHADSLQTFVAALCKSVNVECYCSISWEIMRKLLGTHMGHTALYTMCRFLQDSTIQRDVRLLRGAVFYVNNGLWGRERIPKLKCKPISVLPSFIQALNCNHPIVMFEVTLAIQRLIIKFGTELLEPTWSIILDIIEKVIIHTETSKQPATKRVMPELHETLNAVESLLDNSQYNGCVQRFYELVERCSDSRPESSVLKLIDYRASLMNPTYYHWQSNLATVVDRYYKLENRTNIRVKVLDVVKKVIHINRSTRYEDELIEKIIVPYLQHVDMDPDITIRNVAANLLVDLCLECEIKRCLELLDILEKIINKPFSSDYPITAEADIKDLKNGIVGLIKILTAKIYRLPSSHAITAYKILAGHLELHYKEPQIFLEVPTIRYLIFDCFLKIRANSLYQLGFPDTDTGNVTQFSPYLLLEHAPSPVERLGSGGGSSSPPPVSPAFLQRISFQVTSLSLSLACKNIIACLKQEKDWKVLQLVLREMPNVMQNRALILSRHSNDIDYLAAALCSMVTDKGPRISESFYNVPQKITMSDFLMFVFPVLAALVSYHAHLDPNIQQRLIKCLEVGLTTRCVGQCITSLTTCTLEMRDAMNKLLPDVLLKLSKISATVHIAIPILEFLSTLTRLPKVDSSFIGDQYRLVFAILLPYTNPFKYNHYIVSLAHYVIAIWFLKCRLPLRKDFVKFIIAGLKGNVLEPLEVMKKDFSNFNEDSSYRKRSSSLTEQGSRGRRERPVVGNSIIGDLKPPMDENLMNLNIELTETCIDLMARYTFSTYTARPKRLPAADFLLKEGQSMTWLLGNRLITINTSGCSSKVMRSGLCDNCWAACKAIPSTPEYRLSGSHIPRRSSEENRLSRQSSGNTATNSPTEEEKKSVGDDDVAPVKSLEKREFVTGDKELETSKLEQILGSDKQDEHLLCACWCQGWAEVYVRRPTGDSSWNMRIQNSGQFDALVDFPFHDITALYVPTSETSINRSQDTTTTESFEDDTDDKSEGNSRGTADGHQTNQTLKSSGPIAIPESPGGRFSSSRQSSRDSIESLEDGDEDSRRSRNPVRRSNSSPEMSASWKNPFLSKDKSMMIQADTINITEFEGKHTKNTYAKDLRVNCEAIPEEISGMGTTPPSTTEPGEHTNVLKAQYSYPGATQPIAATSGSSSSNSSNSNTVPASPTTIHPSGHLPVQRMSQHHFPLSKPPLSPTQPYSRASTIDSSLKQSNIENKPPSGRFYPSDRREERPDPSALPPFPFRDRGYTISVMSPVKPPRVSPRIKEIPKTGINPSFIFLQLYHSSYFANSTEKPLLVSPTTALQRAVTNLDRIQPYETHKIGVLFIGAGQASNESEILGNQHGSLRYTEFLKRLGRLVRLKDVDEGIFLGGLDRNGEHGNFTYIWQDDVTQVAFHVATLMPTQASDPKSTRKKQHIGNDYVTIVYNESGDAYDIQTVKGQFNYACVVIQPLDHGTNQVTVQAREELAEQIGHSEPKIVSDQNLGILARQLALHANLASMVSSSLKQKGHSPYASNWLERLRNIKRLRRRLQDSSSNNNSDGQIDEQRSSERVRMDDFTEYTT